MSNSKNKKAEKRDQKLHKHHQYFEDQFEDEEVLFVFRHHPIVMRKGLIFGLMGPLIGVLPSLFNPAGGFPLFFGGLLAGCILGPLIMLPSWIGWYFSLFIITDQRFLQIKQKGLFTRSVAHLGLTQIQSVNYEIKGLQETLLGFGTIRMQTYVGDLTIKDVHHPSHIQKKMATILRDMGVLAKQYPLKPQRSSEEFNETAPQT